MKNIKFINRLALGLAIGSSVLFTSCDGILDVNPRQSIDADGALEAPAAVESAINSVYARLRAEASYGRDLFALSDALADIGQTTSNSGRLIGENNNNPNAHFGHWANSYFAINEANLILGQIQSGVPGATEAQLKRFEGETKFLRALYYFDLVKAYSYIPTAVYQLGVIDEGGIPMSTEGVIDSETAFQRQLPRSSVDEVYNLIYSDLEFAKANLGSRGSLYASSGAASALLSRVALYRGDWAKAVSESTTALASNVGVVTSGMDYVRGWESDIHPESMFEVRFALAGESLGVNVSMQSTYCTIRTYSDFTDPTTKNFTGPGWGDFIPNARIRNFFGLSQVEVSTGVFDVTRNDDIRGYLYTTGSNARGAGRQIECNKFVSKTGFAFADNIPVIRKSEMHLNRAEANYHLGNVADALIELNEFKALRGLGPVILTGADVLEEILIERMKEFAFEGQRFFDLKRYGRELNKVYLGPNNIVPFEDFRILPPIPQREVDGNTQLNQNRGY
ncbi:RagB/SusD family nutrient uptake outer membrane protein [Belliella marina]|uniref:RagB/SusD family nutrient uptake outer membrane protein n=1 Tax=Belliella marina TaxID=1644146 RepID=A0ABW4VVG5_9BACT